LQQTPVGSGGSFDAFLSQIDTTKSGQNSLVYSTFLGGSSEDNITVRDGGVAVNGPGQVYVTGATSSMDFLGQPFPQNSFDATLNGEDAFFVKLDTKKIGSASLEYATYLGGTGNDKGLDIAVDTSGHAYVSGHTASPDFDLKNAFQTTWHNGAAAFVAKFDPGAMTGPDSLIYSSYHGGPTEEARGIAVSPGTSPCIVLVGPTGSPSFPKVPANIPQYGTVGSGDAFVSKICEGPSGFSHPAFAYITHEADPNVLVIDTTTHKVVGSVLVGDTTYGVAVHPDGSRAYVSKPFNDALVVINTATNLAIATVPLGNTKTPIGVAVHPGGGWVYVANSGDDSVTVISTVNHNILETITSVGGAPFGVAVHPDGKTVYVSNFQSNDVALISVTLAYPPQHKVNTTTISLPVGAGPKGMVVHPSGSTLYVANSGDQLRGGRTSGSSTRTSKWVSPLCKSPEERLESPMTLA
jgi:YVTN family beta-propeller protein